jgi:hypothetical protein
MNLFTVHPIRPLLQAWERFRLRCGKRLTRANWASAKQTQARRLHHRHGAFLELR